MSFIKENVVVPSNDGAASTLEVAGTLVRIQYERDAIAPYDPGATFKVEVTHEGVEAEAALSAISLDASGIWHPASAAHQPDGTAITGAYVPYSLAGGSAKVTVTSGGTDKTGSFLITFET